MAACLAAFYGCFFAPSPVFAKKPGWMLRQNSQTYGIVKTILSPDGIRLEMGEIKVAMHPPDWRVTFWNERTKFVFDESIDEFERRIPRREIPQGWLKKVEVWKPYEETLAGIRGKHYRWIAYDPKDPKGLKDPRGPNFPINPRYPKSPLTLYDYVCTENLGLPKRLNDVASICCYVPPGKGMPLRVTGAGNIVYLQTTLAMKMQVDPALFIAPRGYTRVKSEMEVLMKERGLAKEDEVSDLFRAVPKR